jgi:hypothetical protein
MAAPSATLITDNLSKRAGGYKLMIAATDTIRLVDLVTS